jgi:hypothetical protein
MCILARTKKQNNITESNENNAPLTEEQISYMLEFARSMGSSQFPMYTNPLLTNQRMQDVSLAPLIATSDGIDKALANPKDNERNLIGYSENLEISDMLYRRLILYLSGMLSFDLDWVCINAEKKDYGSPAYKKDYAEVVNFLDRFNVKEEFKKILRQMVRKEAFFGQLRTDSVDKYTIQELPEQYCLVTGRHPFGLLFDFNMAFFLNSGISIDMFGKEFKRFYLDLFKNTDVSKYNPAANIDNRTGNYTYYVQTSPNDGFVCFKLFEELASRIPILAPMFPDIVLKPLYRKLSTNSSIQAASKIITGQIPLLKGDVKGASLKDAFAVGADNMAKFLYLLRAGIAQEISLGAAPFENMNSFSYDLPDRNILGDYTQVTASTSGVNSRLIYGYDKQNLEETRNSVSVDEFLMTPVYNEFSNFLQFNINRKTKFFKWKFILSGSEFDTAKRKKLEDAISLTDKGVFIPGMYAAAMNVQKQDLERMLMEAKANKWDEKLIMIIQPSQMSGKESAANGRPTKKDSELSESGGQTREDGGNVAKGGKV